MQRPFVVIELVPFDVFNTDVENLVRAQKAEESEDIDTAEHATLLRPSPLILLVIRTTTRWTGVLFVQGKLALIHVQVIELPKILLFV